MGEEYGGNCMGGSNKEDEKDVVENSKVFYPNYIARMPTERNATYYDMNHKNRGIAVIFNHEYFDIGGLSRRSGTNVDCDCLVSRLEKLGFDVQVFHNLDYFELYTRVTDASKLNHSDNDCFIMVVLTHGGHGILYAKDCPYKPENLWTMFSADKCPSLVGKPKLFFIQACQGDKLDPGVTLNRTETDGHPSNSHGIPIQVDFLIAQSTIPGFYSWRIIAGGSWFIQALCTELDQSSEIHDLLTILTFVIRRVAIDYESNFPADSKMHLQKQVPCITTTLTRLLKLNKKGLNDLENDPQGYKPKEKSKSRFGSIFPVKENQYGINY